jgi:acyl dehydratase
VTRRPIRLTTSELLAAGERDLGSSAWWLIEQSRVDRFADATSDHQWIHVDATRAAKAPFGATIVHGYLLLALLPGLLGEVIEVTDSAMTVNYGTEKLRFTAPVRVGSRVRLKVRLHAAEERPAGILYRLGIEIEIESGQRPALVGDVLFLAVPLTARGHEDA